MSVVVTKKGKKVKIQALTGEGQCSLISEANLYKLVHQECMDDIEGIYQMKISEQGNIESNDLDYLLEEYKDVFEEPQGLPPQRGIEHQILLKPGSEPKLQFPYRVSHEQKNEIEKIVSGLLESGEIQPSKSPFASPVLLVKKKDGSWRLCVDYRYLNSLTIKHNYHIPVIEELLDELWGSVYFSKIDLRSGYFQILMAPEFRHLTAFRTHNGHYEFLVMPFGLCNAPATFQSLMNQIFRKQLRKTVLVFFDDILIFSKTWEEHLVHLREALDILREHQLFAKRSKCQFGQTQISYLGHIISANGVSTDPDKISSMTSWPIPKTLKQLRGFLGLTGYYRRFIQGYGLISKPLTALLKKGNFSWGPEAEEAFHHLKRVMTTAPVLALPDFSQPFVLETDASGTGIGAVLMQQGRPIAYLSKTLCQKHQALPVYEREFLAILLSIQRWRHYLDGHKFIIKTDQQSLKHLLDQKIVTPMQQKWITKLLGFDYEILYKKGVENKAADALSRKTGDENSCHAISTVVPSWAQQITDSYTNDTFLQGILEQKALEPTSLPEWDRVGDVLRFKKRIVVGNNSTLRQDLLREFHGSAVGGHSGIRGTYQRIKQLFYWPHLKEDIEQWVKSCEVCDRNKGQFGLYPGLLQPLPIPDQAWTHISMDFIEGLPKSQGKDVILVVVDRFTKYSHFIPLSHPFSAQDVAKVFLDNVYKLHGLPLSMVTDRDKIFTSIFWKELFKSMGTTLDFTSAYHPQSDGQTERVNQCVENYLRCMVHQNPKKWATWLSLAEFWYNTNYHTSLKATPFEALYGYKPMTHSLESYYSTQDTDVSNTLDQRRQLLQELRDNLTQAQSRMKFFADKHRIEREFAVGEWVYLKLQPFRQQSVVLRKNLKLSARYYGPFKILAKVGKVAYRLDLPDGSRVHPVFHVSLLKKVLSPTITPILELPVIDQEGAFVVTPATILGERSVRRSGREVHQVLVQWLAQDPTLATWEDVDFLRRKFPNFDPWGQGSPQEGSIVRNTLLSISIEEEFGYGWKKLGVEEELVHKTGILESVEIVDQVKATSKREIVSQPWDLENGSEPSQ